MAEIERAAVDTSAIKGIPIIWIMGKTEILFKLLNKVMMVVKCHLVLPFYSKDLIR